MARIKITGYVEVDDLTPNLVDLGDPSGLSSEGFEQLAGGQGLDFFQAGKSLSEVETVLED
jgi:hypothetical protein